MLGESARYCDRNVLSTFGDPALGTLAMFTTLAYNRTANGISIGSATAAPPAAVPECVVDAPRDQRLEGETAEALNLKGADTKTFGQRVTATPPLLPAGHWGGTGTRGGRLLTLLRPVTTPASV